MLGRSNHQSGGRTINAPTPVFYWWLCALQNRRIYPSYMVPDPYQAFNTLLFNKYLLRIQTNQRFPSSGRVYSLLWVTCVDFLPCKKKKIRDSMCCISDTVLGAKRGKNEMRKITLVTRSLQGKFNIASEQAMRTYLLIGTKSKLTLPNTNQDHLLILRVCSP